MRFNRRFLLAGGGKLPAKKPKHFTNTLLGLVMPSGLACIYDTEILS
jgi:hypothetical protein